MMKNNYTRIECSGNNILRILNLCKDNQIFVKNIKRIDYKIIELDLLDKDFEKLKKINKSYHLRILSKGGFRKLLNNLLCKSGLIVGIFLSILFMFFIDNRLFNIHISGVINLDKKEIVRSIEDFGIKKFSKMNFNKKSLETYLSSKFNFSFVSVVTEGNSLLINVKEELKNNNIYLPYVAPYNMIIKNINVYSGTSKYKAGDVVLKNSIIAQPYEYSQNKKIDIMPCLDIDAEVFFVEKYDFHNVEEKLTRTGKSINLNTSTYLGKIKLFERKKSNTFKLFDIVKSKSNFSNYFLPLWSDKQIAYELKKVNIKHNFEKEKNNIINDLKNKAYAKVPKNFKIDKEDITISSTKYGNIVTIYLKSSVYLKYNIK